MLRPLWMAIVLVACSFVVQANLTIQYTNCPEGCKCVQNLRASVMTCKNLLPKDGVGATPVNYFIIADSETPLVLSENIFLNMGLKHVSAISISNSNIVSIDKNAFSGLKELTDIIMTSSKISKLDPETFTGIPNLRTLKLSGNPLDKDTVIASDNYNLEQLIISNCGLKEVSDKFLEKLPAVRLLDLSSNKIEKLDIGIFDALNDLQEINLSNNQLKEIPKELFLKNEDLSTLTLSFNPLESFSSENLEDINTLDLKGCGLKQIDAQMFKNMSTLDNLDLSYNKIAVIAPNAFDDLGELAVIDLAANELRMLADDVFVKNINLQKIRMDGNTKLTKLPIFNALGNHFSVHYFSCNNCNLRLLSKNTFDSMTGIVTLLLSHNKLTDVSTGVFKNLTSLIELDLSYNEIITIEDKAFKFNLNLEKLTLSFNPLKSLHPNLFKHNNDLKMLDLSSCGIFKLWTTLSTDVQLKSILSLNISNNNIEQITTEDMAVTAGLKSLDISKNPLICDETLKDLVKYLYKNDIQNTQYLTHMEQTYDAEGKVIDALSWKEIIRPNCKDFVNFDDEEDDSEETFEDSLLLDGTEKFYESEVDVTIAEEPVNFDEEEEEEEEEELARPVKHKHYHYSYMWPILVFLGTALAVLGLVANVILFVIRRKQVITVPSFINLPKTNKMKKNSGLVYQQLSEEHGAKTPILGRFTPLPTVHGITNEAENV